MPFGRIEIEFTYDWDEDLFDLMDDMRDAIEDVIDPFCVRVLQDIDADEFDLDFEPDEEEIVTAAEEWLVSAVPDDWRENAEFN